MTFALDLSKLVQAEKKRLDLITRKIVLNVAAELVKRSPVDSGRFKGNWDYGFNAVPEREYESADQTPLGTFGSNSAPSYLRAVDGIGNVTDIAGFHYLSNNLSYAKKLENGGSRKQAPHGMVGLTVLKWQAIANDTSKDIF